MAYPTKAQWADSFASTKSIGRLGLKYVDSAPIIQAFGPAVQRAPGNMTVPWSVGATADYIGTAAGAPAGTVAPAQASINSISPALISSQAYTDIWSSVLSDVSDLDMSTQAAFGAITDDVVGGLIGSGDGSANSIWGIDNFVGLTIPGNLGMKLSGSAAVETNVDDAFDQMLAKLPDTGYNIAICSNEGEVALVKRIKAAGGIVPNTLADAAFGQPMLTYRNTLVFSSHKVTDIGGSAPERLYHFYNVGPQGVQITTPNTMPGFSIRERATSGFNTTYDIALAYQALYLSPSAAGVLYWNY